MDKPTSSLLKTSKNLKYIFTQTLILYHKKKAPGTVFLSS
ncbi:hypothetical protein ANACAC_00870 [Anaerostipes caccae L1-92]|uniref:Uncharacterized protein n=1 Tax=Anaerostipes caccae (strain DSM 14662 / CCUG 47493 / JCM 13470 / NCIMB 13811 / L1-92) TaxID=411490 RepID=B0MBE3_ANACD|nr:hypothetical protein ANACAC_00870 [Anaerostipes caccae L1-92]